VHIIKKEKKESMLSLSSKEDPLPLGSHTTTLKGPLLLKITPLQLYIMGIFSQFVRCRVKALG
jgi:hypothetical protein